MLLMRVLVVCLCLGVAGCGSYGNKERGEVLYKEHCAICHGANLRGGGGVGVEGLGRIPADLTLLRFNAGGSFPKLEVLAIIDNYANGRQRGRMMRPFVHLTSEKLGQVRLEEGKTKVPRPQADLLAFLIASQRP